MSGDLTIGRWLSDRARTTPDRVAIRYLDAELTYEALDRRAARLAVGLAARGLGRRICKHPVLVTRLVENDPRSVHRATTHGPHSRDSSPRHQAGRTRAPVV